VSTPEAGGAGLPGRNRVSERALRTVASAITADALGVAPKDVTVVLADDKGLLGVTAETPILVRALDAGHRAGEPTMIDRATTAQATIRQRMLELTGSSVGRVRIRLTATTTATPQRKLA